MKKDIIHNINPAERFIRLVFGITPAIIALGGALLLPLLAIYPGHTATLGRDPLLAATTRRILGKAAATVEQTLAKLA
jgi:hypothetical protein